MQAGTKSDDIHTILSRFNNWSGKHSGDAVQVLDEEVREIPYDEAMRRVRNRMRAGNQAETSARPAERVTSTAAIAAVDAAAPQPAASGDATARPVVAEAAAPVRTAVKNVEALLEAAKVRPARAKPAAKRAVAHAALPARPGAVAAITGLLAKENVKAKTAQVRKKRTAVKTLAAKTVAAEPEEFRQVLAKSVRRGQPAARIAKVKAVERKECVTVPLSSGEKVRLRQCAAMAGVTVPVYLRMRALGMDVPRVEPQVAAASKTSTVIEQSEPMVESHAHGGFGDWITLLRNRFLASPARFAERA